MASDFREATIFTLFKSKGAKLECGNYKGISLLSIAGKILARILLNRLITGVSECFHPGRSTINMMFAVHEVKEKCIKQQMYL